MSDELEEMWDREGEESQIDWPGVADFIATTSHSSALITRDGTVGIWLRLSPHTMEHWEQAYHDFVSEDDARVNGAKNWCSVVMMDWLTVVRTAYVDAKGYDHLLKGPGE